MPGRYGDLQNYEKEAQNNLGSGIQTMDVGIQPAGTVNKSMAHWLNYFDAELAVWAGTRTINRIAPNPKPNATMVPINPARLVEIFSDSML